MPKKYGSELTAMEMGSGNLWQAKTMH